jgi:hypothetical protein
MLVIEFIITILVVFLGISILTSVSVSIWVYRDAKRRNMNVFLWVLIIWLVPYMFGLYFYLISRE